MAREEDLAPDASKQEDDARRPRLLSALGIPRSFARAQREYCNRAVRDEWYHDSVANASCFSHSALTLFWSIAPEAHLPLANETGVQGK